MSKPSQPGTSVANLSGPPQKQWLGFGGNADPLYNYDTYSRAGMYARIFSSKGTIQRLVWGSMTTIGLGLTIVVFAILAIDAPDKCNDDGTKCRPEWFDEQITALVHVAETLSQLATFVLTFYVGQSYSRFVDFYWECRGIQGAINNVAMIVGTNIAYERADAKADPEMALWAESFERYLNLVHFLCHSKTHPVLNNKYKEDPKILMNEQIMGLTLCTEEEYEKLREAEGIGGPNGPMNAVITWLCMLFDEGVHQNYFRGNINESRMISLSMNFQENMESLRGAIAKIGFQKQLPIPLAYAQLMQVFIDLVCILHPFVMVYEVNTSVIESTGYNKYDIGSTLPFTLVGSLIYVYFFQGLMTLAKVFNTPLGDKVEDTTPPSKFRTIFWDTPLNFLGSCLGKFFCYPYDAISTKSCCPPDEDSVVPKISKSNDPGASVADMEFYIEARVILNQVRSGTYLFFNAPKAAPKSVQPVYYE